MKMTDVGLLILMSGDVVWRHYATPEETLEDLCERAEQAFYGGVADYARVTVRGETYMELES